MAKVVGNPSAPHDPIVAPRRTNSNDLRRTRGRRRGADALAVGFDPFRHRPRERCSAAALRAEASDVDVVTRVGRDADDRDLRDWRRITGTKLKPTNGP